MAGVLEVRNLSKSFDGIVVARHIDLTLQAGRVIGLIGPNGAGKTSLFNLICGVVKPDTGTVLLGGKPLDGQKFHQRVRGGLSRTWQHTRLFPSLPVIDNLLVGTHDYPGERLANVLFGPARLKAHDRQARDKALSLLDKMGLASVADDLVSDLPYGQQKLVGVARALMGDAKCLLLDEPMAGVNPSLADEIAAHLTALNRDGITICLIEHDMALIRRLCDPVIVMAEGKTLTQGSFESVAADPRVQEAYLGRRH